VSSLILHSFFLFSLSIHIDTVYFLLQFTMVHFAVTCLVGLLALLQPAIAAPQRQIGASDSTTCIADGKMYRSGNSYRMNSINYVVRCAKDSSGPSFRTHKVPFGGFSMCFEVCERTSGCAGFSFVGSKEGGNCYLKASVGGYVTASDETVTCEKDPGGSGGEPEPMPSSHSSYHWPVSSSTTVVSSSTSGHSSSSVSASVSSHSGHHHHHASGHPHSSASSTHAPAPTKSTGDQCKKTIAQGYSVVVEGGDSYELSCGSDHYGGDFSRADSNSFIGCVRLCDVQPECLGYSYESGVCFLKNSLSGLRSAPGIDFALNLNRTGPSYTASSQYSTSSISASVHHSKPASSTPSEVVLVTVTSYTSSATPSSVSSEYSSEEHHYHHHHHHTKSHGHHTESMAQEWSPHHQTESSESKHHSHHHTKSHHPKPHHTKSHHYTTGSTVTAYVSETYTHTNWITSVSPTTSAEIHHSHTHSHTHTDTHTFHHHNKPIETYTPHPEQETTVADENHCLSLRQEHVQLKKLRVEVITGSKEYEGMYVKDPSRGKYRSIPSHTQSRH
jgi:hypothetical protein